MEKTNKTKLIKAYAKYRMAREKKDVLDMLRDFMPEIIFRTTKLEGEPVTWKMVATLLGKK